MTDEESLQYYYTHVWEGEYANREDFISAVNRLNNEINNDALIGLSIWYSNCPYDLRLLVVLIFNENYKEVGGTMIQAQEIMWGNGQLRTDVTLDDLYEAAAKGQLNCQSLVYEVPLYAPCKYATLSTLKQSVGYEPLQWDTKNTRVFLSHQSERKKEVAQLQASLANQGISTWFDAVDIDFGDSIIKEIEDGINNSNIVIFWISPGFLNSSWCQHEFEGFLHKYATSGKGIGNQSSREVKIIPVVEHGLSKQVNDLNLPIQRLHYLEYNENMTPSDVARALAPTIKKAMR